MRSGLDKRYFRFIERHGDFLWVHHAEVRPDDVDCSTMTDEQFEEHVRNVTRRIQQLAG
jgi:hypothetical protein